MSIKQRKIEIEPRIKLNYNIYKLRLFCKFVHRLKMEILRFYQAISSLSTQILSTKMFFGVIFIL